MSNATYCCLYCNDKNFMWQREIVNYNDGDLEKIHTKPNNQSGRKKGLNLAHSLRLS